MDAATSFAVHYPDIGTHVSLCGNLVGAGEPGGLEEVVLHGQTLRASAAGSGYVDGDRNGGNVRIILHEGGRHDHPGRHNRWGVEGIPP